MIKSVIRSRHYPPNLFDNLYLDDIDHWGLEWLYNDVLDEMQELNKKNNKKDNA